MSFLCEYCNKKFTSRVILDTHIKTAKYCLKIRNIDTNSQYVCEYCNKDFNKKHVLLRHLDVCTNKIVFIKTASENEIISNLRRKR